MDCPMVKSAEVEEVSEVNRDQSEGFMERYCYEEIKEDGRVRDRLSNDPYRDRVHLKDELQSSEMAPNVAESTSNGGHRQEGIDQQRDPRIIGPAQVEVPPPENTHCVPYGNLNL